MKLPVLNGIIDRRILINYRIKPDVVKSLLPAHVDPLIINGYASGGICLLRLKGIGVKYTPSLLRMTSENAAQRFLITYRKDGQVIKGVYIPRRDTDSRLNVLLAVKVFSWPHYLAKFEVNESSDRYAVNMKSSDAKNELKVVAELYNDFSSNSMFGSIENASSCFQNCSVGVSPSISPESFKTIQLKTRTWNVKPLKVRLKHSTEKFHYF